MAEEILISIHKAKDIIYKLNEIEDIVKSLKVSNKDILEKITEIKEILKEATLK